MGDCESKTLTLDTTFKVLNGSIMLCGCGCGGWAMRDTMINKVKGDVRNSRLCGALEPSALFSQVVCKLIICLDGYI